MLEQQKNAGEIIDGGSTVSNQSGKREVADWGLTQVPHRLRFFHE